MGNYIKSFVLSFFIFFLIILNLDVSKKVQGESFRNYTIFIDPGHGGFDGGAVGKRNLVEKDLNLAVALYLRNYLERLGINVLMTREIDTDFAGDVKDNKKRADLFKRVEMINNSNADLYVSIHMNAIENNSCFGAQVFYYPGNDDNKIFSDIMQKNLSDVLNNTNRKAKSINTLLMFRHIKKPGILIEAGFLSNPTEAVLLSQPIYQEKIAFAISLGIIEYLEFKNQV